MPIKNKKKDILTHHKIWAMWESQSRWDDPLQGIRAQYDNQARANGKQEGKGFKRPTGLTQANKMGQAK